MPFRMAVIKMTRDNKCWQRGCEEKNTLVHCCGNVNWRSHCVKQYRFLKNLKMKLIHDPAIPPWRYIHRKWNHNFKELPASPCSLQHYFMVAAAQTVKNPPEMQETHVQSLEDPLLGREDPLEKGTANHSSILAWRIPCTEEPGGL